MESVRDLKNNKSKLKDSLYVGVPATMFEGIDASFNFDAHNGSTLVASLNLEKVVGGSHFVDESSKETGHINNAHSERFVFHF
jgi:hypothetical protein